MTKLENIQHWKNY